MTNLEALKANLSAAHGVVLTSDHYLKALADTGLAHAGTYAAANKAAIDRATVMLYDVIIATANISEGALSYSINVDQLKALRDRLAGELGDTVSGNNVRGVSVW